MLELTALTASEKHVDFFDLTNENLACEKKPQTWY